MPEIADGIVEIKACAREPGHRTKIAVWSNDHNVDPVGACVGARGARVRMVVNELRGEKIDIVPFSEDLPDFVAKALSPAKVNQVNISDDGTQADVIVPDHQLSLAIGREGQNARLAARLTGVRVDIRSETQVAEGVPGRRHRRRRRVRRGRVGHQRRDRRHGVARRRRFGDQPGRVGRAVRGGRCGAGDRGRDRMTPPSRLLTPRPSRGAAAADADAEAEPR